MTTMNPYAGTMKAANEQYHANKSIAQHGSIMHASALAQVILDNKVAKDESEAVSIANAEIQRCQNLALSNAALIHKEARKALDDAARKQVSHTPTYSVMPA